MRGATDGIMRRTDGDIGSRFAQETPFREREGELAQTEKSANIKKVTNRCVKKLDFQRVFG